MILISKQDSMEFFLAVYKFFTYSGVLTGQNKKEPETETEYRSSN